MAAPAPNPTTTVPSVSGPYVIETGSDMAEFCFFDVSSLSDDFDEHTANERRKLLDALEKEGRVCRIRTGADGKYLLHVYVQQELPSRLLERCRKPRVTTLITTKSGEIRVAGTEEVESLGSLIACPRFALAPGTHQATVWKVTWPESVISRAMKERLVAAMGHHAWEQRSKRSPWFAVVLLLGGMFCLIATAVKAGRAYFGWSGLAVLWVAWLVAIQIIPRLLNRPDDERAALLEMETQKDFPDFVIQFHQTDAAA